MHDIRFLRETPEAFDAGLKKRGLAVTLANVVFLASMVVGLLGDFFHLRRGLLLALYVL